MKVLESLKCFIPTSCHFWIRNWYLDSYRSLAYKWVLWICDWWFIRFNNTLIFPNLEPPTINFLYEWSGICNQRVLCCCVFSPRTSLKLIIILSFLFSGIWSILICTLFQDLHLDLYSLIIICTKGDLDGLFSGYIVCLTHEPLLEFQNGIIILR